MEKIFNILACVGLAVLLVAIGWFIGRRSAKPEDGTRTVKLTDTVWVETHDTCWVETSVKISRIDTVRLAYVPEIGESGTYTDRYGYENGESWTHPDTLFIHDSVYVEIPIEEKEFAGENYRIITEGYRTRLKDVWICTPTVSNTVTNTVTRTRHWTGGVGVQIGYGYTTGGMSPYAGIGVSFGYVF